MTSWPEYYHYINYEITDKRTSDWFLTSSFFPCFIITVLYLYFVTQFGPTFMKKRQPFELKKIINIYNVIQIIGCFYYSYMIWSYNFYDSVFKFTCAKFDLTYSKHGMRQLHVAWWVLVIKIFDLMDTVFFILRKKMNQVTFLHVYHHVIMIWITFIGMKYQMTCSVLWPTIMLNGFVHVMMYSYYLLTSIGSECQQKINKIKKYLTISQMIQFVFIVFQLVKIYNPNCNESQGLKNFGYFFIFNVFFFFYLFYDFYQRSYKKKTLIQMKHLKNSD